jgi:hypothetical protein
MISLWLQPPPVFRFPSPAQWDPTRNRWWVRTVLFAFDVALHVGLVVSLGVTPMPHKPPPPPIVTTLVFPKPPPPPPPPEEKQPDPPKPKPDQPTPGQPIIPVVAPPPTPTPRDERWKAGYQIDGTDQDLASVLAQIDGWVAFNWSVPGQRVVFRFVSPDWQKAPVGDGMRRIPLSVDRTSPLIEGLRARAGAKGDAPVNILVTGEYYNRLWDAIDAKKPPGMVGVGYSLLRLSPGAQINGKDLGIEVLNVQPPPPDAAPQ